MQDLFTERRPVSPFFSISTTFFDVWQASFLAFVDAARVQYCQVLADRYPAELSQAHGVVLLMVPLAAAVVPPLASHLPDGRARGVEAAKALAVLAAIGGVACALLAGCAWEERRRRATQHHPYTGAGSRFDLLSGDLSVLTEGAGPAPGPAPGGTRFDLLSGDTALRTGGPFSPVKV